jgi:hypothetical protein
VGSPAEIMKLGEAFSVSVEDSSDPSGDASSDKGGDPWFYLVDLSVKTALYHYIRWHSSVYTLMDIRYVGDDFDIQFFDADRTSLYDAVNSLLKSAVHGAAVCDRQGALYFEIDAGAINNAASTLNKTMFVDNMDWMGTPSITEQYTAETSYLEMGGVAYTNRDNGGSGTFTALLGSAPGTTPAYRGKNLKTSGLALSSQGQLNTLVGNVWENMNADFPEVSLELVGNFRNIDIAPQEVVTMTLQVGDTFRGLNWEQKAFTPRSMVWRYNSEESTFLPQVSMKEITQGNAGQTIAIPVVPPDGGYEEPPPIVPPIIPPLPVPIPTASAPFIPVFHGEDQDTNTPIFIGDNAYLIGGFDHYDAANTASRGIAVMNSPATITVIPLVILKTGVAGNDVRLQAFVDIYKPSSGNPFERDSTASVGYIDITVPAYTVGSNNFWLLADLSISVSVDAGDVVLTTVRRGGSVGSDTFVGSIYLQGWNVY